MTERESTRNGGDGGFWNHPVILVLLIMATAVPLLYPALPPLTDVPGHIATYHIAESLGSSQSLQRYYDIHWELAGNLGVNILIIPLAKLAGIELGLKIVVLFIPMLAAAGFLGIARELHGHVPATALFALPLTYHHAFQFGFLNFSLSAGLCFLSLWLWLRMDSIGARKLRALIFIPISGAVWLTHAYGWGMLGILIFAFQVVERRKHSRSLALAVFRAGIDCAPLAIPMLIMIATPNRNVANTGGWFDWSNKTLWLVSILRERWQLWDIMSAALLLAIALLGVSGLTIRMEPRARMAVLLLFGAYLIMPRVLLGSGYADMRLAAFVVAVALIGLSPQIWKPETIRLVAISAILFVVARICVTTAAYVQISDRWAQQSAAIPHIALGSRVLALDDVRCAEWADDRLDHVSSLAVLRRDAFTNGQFTVAGSLVDVKYQAGLPFVSDPSHLMRRPPCPNRGRTIPAALRALPANFDYLWLVGVPRQAWPRQAGLEYVWANETGLLMRAPAVTAVPTD